MRRWSGWLHATARPFAAFTFDDGYRRQSDASALPMMEKFAAPFTVYVPTGMVDPRHRRLVVRRWPRISPLARPNCAADARDASNAPIDRANTAPIPRWKLRSTITSICCRQCGEAIRGGRHQNSAHWSIERRLRKSSCAFCHSTRSSPSAATRRATSTWRALRPRLSARKWRTIASFLQELTGAPVAHNAYPFGHSGACGVREAEISRSLGFRTAVTTRAGMIFPEHRNHLHALPRVCLTRDESASMLYCKLNGLSRVINSRFGDPVARM